MQGCTDTSSTRQPWALAIKPHATTDIPLGQARREGRGRERSNRESRGSVSGQVKVAGSWQSAQIFIHRWSNRDITLQWDGRCVFLNPSAYPFSKARSQLCCSPDPCSLKYF